ncbi:hypothetical protein [Rhizobium sp. ZW T2_16]|uniref:hypothetical protein n=1 Tax=Rhizobium sp. ZW T2_16 TaxID=3378083 RepID=UPI003851F179
MARVGLKRPGRRAFVFALLCWALPLLCLLATRGANGAALFFQDWGAWAKFLIAPALLTLSEKPIAFAIDECVALLFRIPLIASQSMTDARTALAKARDRTAASLPELTCLALAVGASVINVGRFLHGEAPGWAVYEGGLTLAGLWGLIFGNSLFWFLLTRLMWRHLLWWRFLGHIARCRLRLAVTHPDGHGGLGFLGFYPAGYGLFTVAVSCVFAAGIGHVMQRQTVTPGLFTSVCAAWLAVVAIYFALPLVPLARQVSRLKRDAILLSLTKGLDFERWNERKTLGKNVVEDHAEMNSDTSEVHDLKLLYRASLKTSALLLNKGSVLAALVPALVPLLLAGASFLPYAELGKIVKRLLFL